MAEDRIAKAGAFHRLARIVASDWPDVASEPFVPVVAMVVPGVNSTPVHYSNCYCPPDLEVDSTIDSESSGRNNFRSMKQRPEKLTE